MTSHPDDLSLYDYDLPDELIAQEPAPRREGSRLLVVDRSSGAIESGEFPDLVRHLRAGDLLVVNDARVFPARVRLRRSGGGDAELFLLCPAPCHPDDPAPPWEAIVRPARWARSLRARGAPLALEPGERGAAGKIVSEIGEGRFVVTIEREGRPLDPDEVVALCERIGEVPLPPYIHREDSDPRRERDRERYQTVYARDPVAVAAPTAGLHFTEEILAALERAGVERVSITHQVGLGTFQPIRSADLRSHELHEEQSSITPEAGARILETRREGRRVVAVGTTTVRALESFALSGAGPGYAAPTRLFIRPGHRFRLVDALITNFHLPRSSLLVLVSAFAGRDLILGAYRRAVEERFRFYSYGDAMLIV